MSRAFHASAVVLLCAAGLTWAQNAQAPVRPGFSVDSTLLELAQFLPQDRGGGGSGQSGAQAGQRGQPGGQQGRSGAPAPAVPRDPALFFTAEQVERLLPSLEALREQPYPTPSAGKKLAAEIEALLTGAQKAVRDKLREERQKLLANLPADVRQRMQERQQGGQQRDPLQRRLRLIDNFIRMLEERKKELARG